MSIKIKPLGDRVIIERIEAEERTKGGIIIPDTAKEKPVEGRVVAVGEGRRTEDGKLVPMNLKVNDRVIYSKYAGSEVKIQEKEYLIMREEDILGIVVEEKSASGGK